MTVAIAATEQDTWPARVVVSVTGLTIGNTLRIYRSVGGVKTLVRGSEDLYGDPVTVPSTSYVMTDAELPFGIPVTYIARVNGVDVASTTPTSYTLVGGKVAMTDAIQALAAEVVVLTWPSKRRERKATTYALSEINGSGYNAVVSGAVSQFAGQCELYTDSTSAAESLTELLESATNAIVQVRSPDATVYERFDCYVAVLAWEEIRFSQDGSDPRRRWVLDVVEVDGWADALITQGWTYNDLADAYTGQTYTQLASDFATYLDLSTADIGSL